MHSDITSDNPLSTSEDHQMQHSLGEMRHADLAYFGPESTFDCHVPSRCLHGIFEGDTIAGNYKKLDSYY
jgi:hypothetical protein